MVRSASESQQPVNPDREQQGPGERKRQDELLDEALEETFPASDAIAPATVRDKAAQ